MSSDFSRGAYGKVILVKEMETEVQYAIKIANKKFLNKKLMGKKGQQGGGGTDMIQKEIAVMKKLVSRMACA